MVQIIMFIIIPNLLFSGTICAFLIMVDDDLALLHTPASFISPLEFAI